MNKKIIFGIIIAGISIIVIISAPFVLNSYKGEPNPSYYGSIRLPENDKLCTSSIVIYHASIGHKEIEQYIREEITKFGSQYDFPEREITIKQESDTVTVKIVGVWSHSDTGDRPNLHKALSKLFDVELGGIDRMVCS